MVANYVKETSGLRSGLYKRVCDSGVVENDFDIYFNCHLFGGILEYL